LREAAEKGNASDQYHFGRCYENSLSLRLNPNGPVTLVVPQDYAEAIKWYRKAAEKNFFMAQAELGRMLYAGLGSPQNYQEAFRWFRNAAEQDSIMGQFGLGVMYEFGEIVVQDKVEAYKWYSLAAAEGKTEVIKYRDNMMRSLTPEQIAEGQRRAAAFVPRKAGGR